MALTERDRPQPRERLPKERSSEGWMERSGTLAEPSDNSTTPYIKKRPTLLGQPHERNQGGEDVQYEDGQIRQCVFPLE